MREWLFRLVAMFGYLLVLLGCLEGTLRLAGYGFSTCFFKPLRIGGQDCLVDNDQFGLRFFPPALARIPAPVVMEAVKPAGTIRIFVFGESAALGDPRPHYGAARYLEALLRERFPGQEFEVVNTAMTAINSHVILPLARECAARQGDVWVIYMGNNEMVGPFGAATVFGRKAPPLWLVRTTVALQRARFCQLLLDLGRGFDRQPHTAWHGLEMFMQNQVSPEDPRRQVIYESFAGNLDQILRAGLDSKAKILLSTVAVNLKDCPPFASASTNRLDEEKLRRYDELCARAAADEAGGNWVGARHDYDQAAALNPSSAQLQFRLGRCCVRSGDANAGREHLQSAVNRDALPFRADSRINDSIREAGRRFAGPNLVLCDAAGALGHGSPPGMPGEELFYEHVHLNFDGNYRLALAWAEGMQELLPPALASRAVGGWASQETCERRLGLTDWNRLSVFEEIERRLKAPPFTGQWEALARVEQARAQVEAIRRRMTNGAVEPARAVYEQALKRAPTDAQLHEAYAEFLSAVHEPQAAIAERRKVCDLIPHYYFPFLSLGQIFERPGPTGGVDGIVAPSRGFGSAVGGSSFRDWHRPGEAKPVGAGPRRVRCRPPARVGGSSASPLYG